jgi:hypothetical protein
MEDGLETEERKSMRRHNHLRKFDGAILAADNMIFIMKG